MKPGDRVASYQYRTCPERPPAPRLTGVPASSYHRWGLYLVEGGQGPERVTDGMLRVPTFVAPSQIAGVGLFAATDLPAGTIIWEFTEGVDWRITPEEFALFPEPFRSRLRHYVYQEDSGTYVLCGDNAKFMNHCEEPNCDDPEGEYTITRKLIHAGEELTCDYRSFDLESRDLGLGYFMSEGRNGNGIARNA